MACGYVYTCVGVCTHVLPSPSPGGNPACLAMGPSTCIASNRGFSQSSEGRRFRSRGIQVQSLLVSECPGMQQGAPSSLGSATEQSLCPPSTPQLTPLHSLGPLGHLPPSGGRGSGSWQARRLAGAGVSMQHRGRTCDRLTMLLSSFTASSTRSRLGRRFWRRMAVE